MLETFELHNEKAEDVDFDFFVWVKQAMNQMI
jgi:hypothetical protein